MPSMFWNPFLKFSMLSPYISTSDMKTITPADKLKETARVTGFAKRTNRLKKTISPPIHVDSPAAIVNPNANPTLVPVCTMMMAMKNKISGNKTNVLPCFLPIIRTIEVL